jgi:germination protein M
MSKQVSTIILVLLFSLVASGCGLFGDQESLDPPQDVSYLEEVDELESLDEESKANETTEEETSATETVMTELYLINEEGLVVAQTLPLPKTEGVAAQALEYLVDDGPVMNILPNGFRPVLPAGTEMSVDVKDGVAIVDFSKEFLNYHPDDEKRILQAITWTLTQFDSIDKIELRVNGQPLSEMPVNGTPISEEGLSRKDGINLDISGIVDITNSNPITVYYLAQNGDQFYYVPVTKRVESGKGHLVEAVVKELVNGPPLTTNLVTMFLPDVKLVEQPRIQDGTVTLNFNEALFGGFGEQIVSEQLLHSLVLSLTEIEGIESVVVTVNGQGDLLTETGKSLSEPVSRPDAVNTIGL